MKNDFISYKGYYGSINFDQENEIFYGKVEFIRDLITYEASDAKDLIKSFREAIDDYLLDCDNLNKIPDKPFKGSFNVRVHPDLHKEVSLYAIKHGETLNNIVKKALDEFIHVTHKGVVGRL